MISSRGRLRWDLGQGREVGLAFWGMVLLEAAFGAYLGVWPLWIERLGAPITVVGLVLGSSGVIRLLFLVPSAALADRFSVRNLIVFARCSALIGLLGAAFAQHWTHLAIMVIGSAVGELAFPLIQTHVAAQARGNRIRAFSLVFTVGPSMALFVAPLLSGALIAQFGLRSAFVFAAAATAASILCFARLRTTKDETPEGADTASSYAGALSDLAVRRILILQGCTVFAICLGTSLIPTYLEDVRDFSPSRIATLGALAAVGSTVFGLIVARATRLQAAPFIGVAIATAATSLAFVIFLSTGALWLVAVAFVLRGGLFSAWAMCSAAIGAAASERHRARSFALGEIAAGTGFSLAPMVAGWLFGVDNRLPLVVALTCGLALLPVLLLVQRDANARVRANIADAPAVGSDAPAEAPLPV